MSKPRVMELRRRQRRAQRLAALRAKYAVANEEERAAILARVTRVSPTVPREQFLAAVTAQQAPKK